MTEHEFTRIVHPCIKSTGCFYFKCHGGAFQQAGMPDFIISHRGLFVGLELKVHPRKITPLQDYTRADIEKHGGLYILATLHPADKQIEWEHTYGAIKRSFTRESFRDQLGSCVRLHLARRHLENFSWERLDLPHQGTGGTESL